MKKEKMTKRKTFHDMYEIVFFYLLETVFLVSRKKIGTISDRMEFYIK